MEMGLKVKIMSEERIKPSSPTAESNKHLKFSLLDQLALPVYVPLLLFYDVGNIESNRSLKVSLSEELTRFYPFGGRVDGNNESIICNDEGAIFVEAKANCLLSEFLNQLKIDSLREFLPFEIGSRDGAILLVQITSFECGGMAIGLLMSHKISDASSISTFIKSWTATARGDCRQSALPVFIGESVLQPSKDFPISTPTSDSGIHAQGVTKRLVFEASKIIKLKEKAASNGMPTRVEAVTGLIWKCAIVASKSGKPSVVGQAVNLRKRLVPTLPDNSIGNLLGFITPEAETTGEIDLQGLVGLLREGITEFNKIGFQKYQDTEAYINYFKTLMNPEGPYGGDKNFYLCSSWSRFQFYEADFGWGSPVWFIGGISMFSNFFLLMDTKDGQGIEALVTLSEEEMALFETDQDLLEYASINPKLIHC